MRHPIQNLCWTGGVDSVKDEYVNGGHLLIEGDQRGGELLIEESPARPFLREK